MTTIATHNSGHKDIELVQDEIGFHVYYFEYGECLCSDTFDNEVEARAHMEEMINDIEN